MLKKFLMVLTLATLVLALAACSAAAATPARNGTPGAGGRPNGGTFVAATATTAPTDTATALPTETATAEPTLTPTPTSYTSTVITSIGCLSGPGENYPIIGFVSSGDTVVTYGRNATNDYYYVLNTNTGKPCWVWDNYITVNSPSYELPVVTTATATALNAITPTVTPAVISGATATATSAQ